jgi:dephospho-CoA kinase
MFQGKPIIGIAGGIGSGKSMVARFLADLGCHVIDSDELSRQAYRKSEVVQTLQSWWGDAVVQPDGSVDRRAVAKRVFSDETQLRKLEGLIHPLVEQSRQEAMDLAIRKNPDLPAFVWDSPLLFESGLSPRCDAVIFVQTPLAQRVARVSQTRGWDEAELTRRENLQWPLDKKREISDYVVVNTADAEYARSQVNQVLSRTLVNMKSVR